MPWTTPPTFSTGQVLAAADLNILSEDLDFLKGRGNTPILPHLTYLWTVSGDAYFVVRYRTGFNWLHYSYTNWSNVAGGLTIRRGLITVAVPTTIIYNDGAPIEGTTTGSVNMGALTDLEYYVFRVTYTKSVNSNCRMNYLELRDAA